MKDRIEKTELPSNASKKYIPIHISLFGFKTIEEVQSAIFVELYPFIKKKGVKLAAGIMKTIMRGAAHVVQAGDIDKYFDDLSQEPNDFLNYNQLVICFDDIDRKNSDFKIQDLYGFINSLVENQGAKIIIIANEPILKEEKDYIKAREKVVGVTVRYNPTSSLIFDEIINQRYKGSLYHDFLIENKSIIVKVIEENDSNFRNLIFFLEYFKLIFNSLEAKFQENESFRVSKDEKLKAILNFTLAISIEYKLGKLSYSEIERLEEYKPSIILDFNEVGNEKDNKQKGFDVNSFASKYYNNDKYYYFDSISKYILGVKAFDIEYLAKELSNYFRESDGQSLEQDIILDKLRFINCLDLTDEEYAELTSKMLEYVDMGGYKLVDYVAVFYYAARFNNLLSFDIEALVKRIKEGIKKGSSNYEYDYHLDFRISLNKENKYIEEFSEIRDCCIDINKSLLIKKNINVITSLLKLFKEDFEEFYKKITDQTSYLTSTSFWNKFDVNEVEETVFKLKNSEIWRLASYFQNRYKKLVLSSLYPEKEFLEEIKLNMKKANLNNSYALNKISIDHFVSNVELCLKNFPDSTSTK